MITILRVLRSHRVRPSPQWATAATERRPYRRRSATGSRAPHLLAAVSTSSTLLALLLCLVLIRPGDARGTTSAQLPPDGSLRFDVAEQRQRECCDAIAVDNEGRLLATFARNGRWFAAATSSGVSIHDATTGAHLLTLAMLATNDWLAWTPDGRYAGSPAGIARLGAIRQGRRALPLTTVGRQLKLRELLEQVLP